MILVKGILKILPVKASWCHQTATGLGGPAQERQLCQLMAILWRRDSCEFSVVTATADVGGPGWFRGSGLAKSELLRLPEARNGR